MRLPVVAATAPPAAAAQETLLAILADLVESAFDVVGEGVLLGTLPPYLERFGVRNAEYLERHHLDVDARKGAPAALTPMNFVSRITGTPFTMVAANQDRAVKRLHACEFQAALAGKSDFAKALMCQIHRSAYQGSVNGLLADPAKEGYDVTLQSRILFGDPHCDLEVTSRAVRPAEPGGEGIVVDPVADEELARDAHTFYTAILVSLVNYLTTVLPPAAVQEMLHRSAVRAGARAAGGCRADAEGAVAAVRRVLLAGGREADDGAGGVLTVDACPYSHTIRAMSRGEAAGPAARGNACLLCLGTLRGAAHQASPGAQVEMESSLAVEGTPCRFRVVP